MPSPSLRRRRTLVLLLAAALSTSWVSAAGSKAPASPRATAAVHQDFLARAWSLLASLWGEEGCNLDPNGRCATGAAQPVLPRVHTDTGCNLDPNGHCATGAIEPVPPRVHNEGCNIDPNGHCTSTTRVFAARPGREEPGTALLIYHTAPVETRLAALGWSPA